MWRAKSTKESISAGFLLAVLLLLSGSAAECYPEYQAFIEKRSGKTVDCAVCHVNANGPVGRESGQIGSLSQKQLAQLNAARAAIEPEMLKEDNPILNRLGNSIIRTIGKKKFLEHRQDPEKLAELLGNKSDLDNDGIPDSQEYLDGTDALNSSHGEPFKLFLVNLNRYKYHLALAALAVFILDWGFAHLIQGFYLQSKMGKAGNHE
ncbi:MAG: hypothetical protein K2X27_16315 [Candidatus Obscuribacterales bacterium]|nr:hypothetical protein [Candidatus Obscuribacterales bacterium]